MAPSIAPAPADGSPPEPVVEQPGWSNNNTKPLEVTFQQTASQGKKKKKKNKKSKTSKPTGFEEYTVDGPLTKDQVDAEQELYHPSKPFTERIETCIQRYKARRKWDATRLQLFTSYLALGGIATGSKQFSGGLDIKKAEEQELDAEEIHRLTATDYVTDKDIKNEDGEDEWEVDFAYVIRGFLSYKVPYVLGYQKIEDLELAPKVITNFLNYVVLHDVCPEYVHSIQEAKAICVEAETQLPLCRKVSNGLPGVFNMACSTLFDGYYAGMRDDIKYTWEDKDDSVVKNVGLDPKIAEEIFTVCLAKRGTPQQQELGLKAKVIKREYISMEVVGIKLPNKEDPLLPDDDPTDPMNKYCRGVKSLGQLQVKTWVPEQDEDSGRIVVPQPDETFEIWLEKEILQWCYLGMHLEARVHKLDSGLVFIDSVTGVMCSFFLRLDTSDTKDSDAVDDEYD